MRSFPLRFDDIIFQSVQSNAAEQCCGTALKSSARATWRSIARHVAASARESAKPQRHENRIDRHRRMLDLKSNKC